MSSVKQNNTDQQIRADADLISFGSQRVWVFRKPFLLVKETGLRVVECYANTDAL